jgi:formylglycine-generating enzyme required for sulfatase activity
MKAKKIAIFLPCLLMGIVAVFLLHQVWAGSQSFEADSSQAPTSPTVQAESASRCPQEMAWIPGGAFRMGSENQYAEEKPVEGVSVDGFCMDIHEVTNGEFAKFVEATGYVTIAERPLSAEEFPTLSEEARSPGSLVFKMPPAGSQKVAYLSWWKWTPGANWRHPEGPDSTIEGLENYPVVHIAFPDAQAYAEWADKAIPTESQWEFAARGGLKRALFTWGNDYKPDMANTWQGIFPFSNTQEDHYLGTAPVGSFSGNGYGLYDMAGNVWEWTEDWYHPSHQEKANHHNPSGPQKSESYDPRDPGVVKHVIKGGSYLCAPNYCSRYRPGAREAEAPDTGTSHIGFRLIQAPSSGAA